MRALLAGMKVGVILIFMTQRYKPQQDLNDTWTIIDARTARAAEMGSRTIIGMNRRAEKSEKVIASILATFKFVRDDTLTVGISVAHPPLSTYATDAKTVVGYDPALRERSIPLTAFSVFFRKPSRTE